LKRRDQFVGMFRRSAFSQLRACLGESVDHRFNRGRVKSDVA